MKMRGNHLLVGAAGGLLVAMLGCSNRTLVQFPIGEQGVQKVPFEVGYDYEGQLARLAWLEIMAGRKLGYTDEEGRIHDFVDPVALEGRSEGELSLTIISDRRKAEHYRAVGTGLYTDYVVEKAHQNQPEKGRSYAPVQLVWSIRLESPAVSLAELEAGGKRLAVDITVFGIGPDKNFFGTLTLPKVNRREPIVWPPGTLITLYHKGTGYRVAWVTLGPREQDP